MARPKKFDYMTLEGIILVENIVLGKTLRQISEEYGIGKSTLSQHRKEKMKEYESVIKLRDEISRRKRKREHNTLIGWKLEVLIVHIFKRYGRKLPVKVIWTGRDKGSGVDVVVIFEDKKKMLLMECKNWKEETWMSMDMAKVEEQILSRFKTAEEIYSVPSSPWEDYEKIWVLVVPLDIPYMVKRLIRESLPKGKELYLWGIRFDVYEPQKRPQSYIFYKFGFGLSFFFFLRENPKLERKLRSKTLRIMERRAIKDIYEDLDQIKERYRAQEDRKRRRRKRR